MPVKTIRKEGKQIRPAGSGRTNKDNSQFGATLFNN